MARLATVGALLMFLLAIAHASVYRTIVTTVVDEPNPFPSERCRQQIQGMRMDSCMRYLQPTMLLPQMGGHVQPYAQQCCNELENVSQECKCEAIQQIVESVRGFQGQQQRGQQQQQMMREVMQKAQQLPQVCGFQQQCQIRQDEY
ncbi:hypothetical protein ACHQM5_006350 [Ranunculus cassubicifolius]